MKKSAMIHYVQATVDSIEDSIRIYEECQRKAGRNCVFVGFSDLTNADSKTSILRRITLAREQLLELARVLKEE